MSDPPTLILLALAAAPRHGYAIQREIEERASVRLGLGTLYGAIARLEDAGLITALRSAERRRPYRITAAGNRELSRRLDAVRALAAWANAVGAA